MNITLVILLVVTERTEAHIIQDHLVGAVAIILCGSPVITKHRKNRKTVSVFVPS